MDVFEYVIYLAYFSKTKEMGDVLQLICRSHAKNEANLSTQKNRLELNIKSVI